MSKNPFHVRVICKECGWSYHPSNDCYKFGPSVCPDCGNYRGNLPAFWELEDRKWLVKTVKEYFEKRPIHKFIPIKVNKFVGYQDRKGNG